MKVLSIIGTRPQYIKFKPLHDALASSDFQSIVIDSRQHYSYEVSERLIEDLNLKIDYSLENTGLSEIDFITKTVADLSSLISKIAPKIVIIMGDTNTSFCAALAANKLKVDIAHIEAGERSQTEKPEEINRQYCDSVSKIHFCSARRHMKNVKRPIYTGDLEYELLNSYNPKIEYGDFGFLTLHRQENMSIEKLGEYFKLISSLNYKIIFPVHHRTRQFLKSSKIQMPKNIVPVKSMGYLEAIEHMRKCSFMLTDSGGVQKCSPFFGKRCLVLREEGEEWSETYSNGYCLRFSRKNKMLSSWLTNNDPIDRNKYFYCDKNKLPTELIMESLRAI